MWEEVDAYEAHAQALPRIRRITMQHSTDLYCLRNVGNTARVSSQVPRVQDMDREAQFSPYLKMTVTKHR